jgi:hypothetical protein
MDPTEINFNSTNFPNESCAGRKRKRGLKRIFYVIEIPKTLKNAPPLHKLEMLPRPLPNMFSQMEGIYFKGNEKLLQMKKLQHKRKKNNFTICYHSSAILFTICFPSEQLFYVSFLSFYR